MESLAQGFFCEFYEISTTIFSTEHLQATASVILHSARISYNFRVTGSLGKRCRIRSYSAPHFSRPNAGICEKNTDQNDYEYRHFLRKG